MVGQEQATTGSQHAHHLGDGAFVARDAAQAEGAYHAVKSVVSEWKFGGITLVKCYQAP